MSECTKGKLRVSGDYVISPQNKEDFIRIFRITSSKAYADEIVRRWNAFEDGGIVEELRTALEEAQKVFGFIAENYKSAPHFPNAERLVEAALAKS